MKIVYSISTLLNTARHFLPCRLQKTPRTSNQHSVVRCRPVAAAAAAAGSSCSWLSATGVEWSTLPPLQPPRFGQNSPRNFGNGRLSSKFGVSATPILCPLTRARSIQFPYDIPYHQSLLLLRHAR